MGASPSGLSKASQAVRVGTASVSRDYWPTRGGAIIRDRGLARQPKLDPCQAFSDLLLFYGRVSTGHSGRGSGA
jgi:hypothetical protein